MIDYLGTAVVGIRDLEVGEGGGVMLELGLCVEAEVESNLGEMS